MAMGPLFPEDYERKVSVRSITLFGITHAHFIHQLHYWIKGTEKSHLRDGRKWHYETITAWNEQLFWISRRTLCTVISDFEKWGIVLSTSKYNKMHIDKTKWYTIDYDRLDFINNYVSENQLDCATFATAIVQNLQLPYCNDCNTNNQKTTQKINQEDYTGENPVKKTMPKTQYKTAEEAKKAILKKQGSYQQKTLSSHMAAMHYFRSVVPQLYEDVEFQAEPTKKEQAQFKLFWKRAEGHGEGAMKAVLSDWTGFTSVVQDQLGIDKVPYRPTIGFLLLHVTLAVNWYLSKQAGQKPTAMGSAVEEIKKTVEIPAPGFWSKKPKGTLIG